MVRFDSATAMRECVSGWRALGEDVAYVPTMGNLHAGHMELVRTAASGCRRVVTSIFVNPTQFGPNEDFSRYPRTLDADLAKLLALQCDAVFIPDVHDVYPLGVDSATRIEVPGLSDILCGKTRPGHFAGVASVMLRLLNIVEPDSTFLGAKDFQQLMILRRLAEDLSLRTRMIAVPTVRDPDGLALSSRNGFLDPAQRALAPLIFGTLQSMRDARLAGVSVAELEATARANLLASGFVPDYATLRRAGDLQPVGEGAEGEEVALIAARIGSTRLIDNLGFEAGP